MSILIKGRCEIVRANWRIMQYLVVDVEHKGDDFGEYIAMNVLRERGMLEHDKKVLITIDQLGR